MVTKDSFDLAADLGRGTQVISADGDWALQIRYIGSEDQASVTIAADGNLAFKEDDSAYTGIQIGAVAGTIDVSNASADTFGEVVDAINTTGTFEAAMAGALRTDSANDTLLVSTSVTDQTAGYEFVVGGVNMGWKKIYKDTSAAKNIALALSMCGDPRGMFNTHHDASTRSVVYGLAGSLTTCSATGCQFEIYECEDNKFGTDTTETLLYQGALDTDGVMTAVTWDNGIKPATKDHGYRLVARLIDNGSTPGACTTGSLSVDYSLFDMPRA